jgi:hypothetical protein
LRKPSKLQWLFTEATGHIRSKVVMLLLAALCWFFVKTDGQMEVDFNFPLNIDMDSAPGMVLLNEPPSEVHVRLRGRGRSLLAFALFRKGSYELRPEQNSSAHGVSAKNLFLDGVQDLSVQSIYPAVIQLKLDRLDTRRIPIEYNGTVSLASGYLMTSRLDIKPVDVLVSGARSILDTLSVIQTEKVNFEREKRDLDKDVPLRLPWPTLNLARNSINLTCRIEKISERRFTGIPLEIRNMPDSLIVSPEYFALTVSGGKRQLDALQISDVKVRINLSRAITPPDKIPCQVIVPSGFNWSNPEPALFDVMMRPEWADSLAFDSLRVDSLSFLDGDKPAWMRFH